MKISVAILAAALGIIAANAAPAAEKPAKQTCCQEAFAKKEECKHRCCIAAHKDSKSCLKCNPNQEDLKLKKDPKSDPKGPKK
jgi:hypothetical protein